MSGSDDKPIAKAVEVKTPEGGVGVGIRLVFPSPTKTPGELLPDAGGSEARVEQSARETSGAIDKARGKP